MRVIVSAGGTGGHIYPALSIINKIKEKEPSSEFLYIGTTDRMEKDIIPQNNINYLGIPMKGINRRNIFKNFKVISCFNQAIKKSKQVIKEFNPDVVLGIGGYITSPVIYAAKKMGYKTFIHEQNSIPGLSNKFLSKYADIIGVSLPSSVKYFNKDKVIFTGNPRSEEVVNYPKVNKKKYNLSTNKKLVLIVMGSLGSLTISNRMKEILLKFNNKDYEVLFVTGKSYYDDYKNLSNVPQNVKIVPYLDDMLGVLKVVDLMVTRAGASTIAEITSIGIPTIFIPSPYVTNNHQLENAKVLEKEKAAVIIEEKDLSSDLLIKNIDDILNDSTKYDIMKLNSYNLGVRDSATKIYTTIRKLIDGE